MCIAGSRRLRGTCFISTFIDKVNSIRHLLTEEHFNLIDELPSAHFFYINETIKGEEKLFHQIIASYSVDYDAFKIGKCLVRFTSNELCLILGLRNFGRSINLRGGVSKVREQYLHGFPFTKENISEAVTKAANDEDVSRVVKLLVLLLLVCFLLPTSGGRLPPGVCSYVDNLSALSSYSWGECVYKFLMEEIPQKAKAIQERKGKEGVGYLKGCTQSLLVWVKEHSKNVFKRLNEKRSPRLLNWEMMGKDLKYFRNIKKAEVIVESLKLHSFEVWLVNPSKTIPPSIWLVNIKEGKMNEEPINLHGKSDDLLKKEKEEKKSDTEVCMGESMHIRMLKARFQSLEAELQAKEYTILKKDHLLEAMKCENAILKDKYKKLKRKLRRGIDEDEIEEVEEKVDEKLEEKVEDKMKKK